MRPGEDVAQEHEQHADDEQAALRQLEHGVEVRAINSERS